MIGAAIRLATALGLVVGSLATPAHAGAAANCADYGNLIDFTLEANLEISAHGTKCLITGTVDGNVSVVDHSTACDPPPAGMGQQFAELTAANIVGGSVRGNIRSAGGWCAMVWLRDGASVAGNVTHTSAGNLGFLDVAGDSTADGSTVAGSVHVDNGKLFASSVAADNRIDGHITCGGGLTSTGNSGTAADWDGDGGSDGTIGGHYDC